MSDNNELTLKEERAMRRWFKKIDDNTLELKEKRFGFVKITLLIPLFISIYFSFIDSRYKDFTLHRLEFTFQPETRFQENWKRRENKNNPGFTKEGRTKEDFMKGMWELHKKSAWDGYYVVGEYLIYLILLLWPNKRRFRFDRKRGIIYTYNKGKLSVTEINKLMRPLPEYFGLKKYGLSIWVHPYEKPKGLRRIFPASSHINFLEFEMWKWGYTQQFDKSLIHFMQKSLLDFMNPNTDPDLLSKMMLPLDSPRSPFEWFTRIFVDWIDTGLYCKRLPKQSVLEKKLADYFANVAPTIKEHPSWEHPYQHKFTQIFKKGSFRIISVEENKKAGFTTVPCPNLFEHPETSIHDNWSGLKQGITIK